MKGRKEGSKNKEKGKRGGNEGKKGGKEGGRKEGRKEGRQASVPDDILLIGLCLVQSSEKLPPTADGNNRDSQTDIMQRVRDLGTLNPKWDVSIKPFLLGLREPS